MELKFDLITSNGDKDLLTLMAEGQARAGHDIMGARTWYVYSQKDRFVPVDDIMNPLIDKYGKIVMAAEYCAKIEGAGWPFRPAMEARWHRPAPVSTT